MGGSSNAGAVAVAAPDKSYAYLFTDWNHESFYDKPVIGLIVAAVKGKAPEGKAKLKGAKLSLYECDYTKTFALDEKSTLLIAELTFDLVPNPALATEPDAPHWAIINPKLKKMHWKGDYTSRPPKAKDRAAKCDFSLFLGGEKKAERYIPLRVPLDKYFHDEGAAFEIGMKLELPGDEPIDRRDYGYTSSVVVPAKDTLEFVRSMHFEAKLAVHVDHFGKGAKVGRFNGAGRNPQVEPDVAHKTLDDATLARLKAGDAVVDVDGLRFTHFCDASKRRDFITALLKEITVKPGKRQDELKDTDIEKAYFVIHDIGAGVTDRIIDSNPNEKKSETVTGYVNHDGTYGARKDLFWGRSGAVYLALAKWVDGYAIGFETVPLVAWKYTNDPKKNAHVGHGMAKKQIGTKKNDKGKVVPVYDDKKAYWHWTHALLDTLANLYILASARANHLLTITCHVEADRNMVWSWLHHQYGAEALRTNYALPENKGGDLWRKLLDGPWDVHGDPYGFDPQVLYDKITKRLNALSKTWASARTRLELPERKLRYGINPARIVNEKSKDADGLFSHHVNGDGQLHTFPHQSADAITSLPGKHKKALTWWKE